MLPHREMNKNMGENILDNKLSKHHNNISFFGQYTTMNYPYGTVIVKLEGKSLFEKDCK